MPKVSVIIPSRTERFLPHTIAGLLSAGSDIEIIVVLDGYWPDPPLVEDKRLIIIHRGTALGMRAGINAAVEIAKGEWLMKSDAHCIYAPGFDAAMQADCADNWIMIPRRYKVDGEHWTAQLEHEPIDSEHLFYPYEHPDDLGLHARPWIQRGRERRDILIDEDMTFQGSCWFMHRKHWQRVGPLQERGYGTFMNEPQEIGFKTWLGRWDGKIVRNKKTWYAHLHKGRTWGRMYPDDKNARARGNAYGFNYWWNDRWSRRAHDLEWLIDRFWPVPGWEEDWRKHYHVERSNPVQD